MMVVVVAVVAVAVMVMVRRRVERGSGGEDGEEEN